MDDEGLVPDSVEEELQRQQAAGTLPRVKAIYVTTSYDNPSGITLPAHRRAALVELTQRWSRATGRPIYLIEDAAYRELRYDGDDIASMRSLDPKGETVIVAGSFSKSLSPGLRVGWGILPPSLVEPLLAAKGNFDFGSPNFNQVLLATILESGMLDRHLDALRACYRAKFDALVDAAQRHLAAGDVRWVRPTGGLYLWLELLRGTDTGLAGPLFDRAVAEGVLYVPGEYCYPKEGCPVPRNRLRLSVGFPSADACRRGIEALGRAIRQVHG